MLKPTPFLKFLSYNPNRAQRTRELSEMSVYRGKVFDQGYHLGVPYFICDDEEETP